MKLGLQKYDILKFGQCLNLNAQTSVLFVYKWKPNMETSIFHVLLTPLIKTSKVGNVKEGKCYRPNSAGRVRLNLIIRIRDSSDLESHKRLSQFLWSHLEDYIRICKKRSRTYSKLQPQNRWHVPDMSYIGRYPRWYWDPSFHIWR